MTWIAGSRPLEPVLGRKFHVESEFDVKNEEFLHPGGEKSGKNSKAKISTRKPPKTYFFMCSTIFGWIFLLDLFRGHPERNVRIRSLYGTDR